MTTFENQNLDGARFHDLAMRGARMTAVDLSGSVLRGVVVDGVEIESPWLFETEAPLRVNGVDVAPFVDAELDRRFPGRSQRTATDPEGLRAAWEVLQQAWAAALRRAEAMPDGSVDISVDGEWSFAQTLRHLVHATDVWLRKAILGVEDAYHPLGITFSEAGDDEIDRSVFTTSTPSYAEVLAVRAEHVGLVRDFIARVTTDELAQSRPNPWAPEHQETVLSCLRTILDEEWEHLRYALRDLDAIDAGTAS